MISLAWHLFPLTLPILHGVSGQERKRDMVRTPNESLQCQIDADWSQDHDVVLCGCHFFSCPEGNLYLLQMLVEGICFPQLSSGQERMSFQRRNIYCLLWINKARAKDKRYIWVSVWRKKIGCLRPTSVFELRTFVSLVSSLPISRIRPNNSQLRMQFSFFFFQPLPWKIPVPGPCASAN